jgi:hypothetical protein
LPLPCVPTHTTQSFPASSARLHDALGNILPFTRVAISDAFSNPKLSSQLIAHYCPGYFDVEAWIAPTVPVAEARTVRLRSFLSVSLLALAQDAHTSLMSDPRLCCTLERNLSSVLADNAPLCLPTSGQLRALHRHQALHEKEADLQHRLDQLLSPIYLPAIQAANARPLPLLMG